jgi:preprotein translocase subunit SecE
MANKIKKNIQKLIQQEAPEWMDEQLVRLGNYSHQVLTSVAGRLYARQYNGRVIVVYNGAHVPAIFDLHVRVGRKKSLPNIWQIIAIEDDYDTPAGSGQLAYHHTQHEFPAADTVWVSRKQIVPLTVLVSDAANKIVQVIGSVVHTASGIRQISSQTVNLSSYVPTAGAKFASIESNDEGVLSVHDGTVFAAPELGTYSNIPVPAAGKYLLAYVLLYESQTALSNDDIRVPMPLALNAAALQSGTQIHDASADTPLDADEFGFWDVVDSLLKKITWANIKLALKTYFDTLYSALGHTHASSGGGGELLMQDGVTSPPVPLETEDGTDWLYQS